MQERIDPSEKPNDTLPGLKQFRHEGCSSYLFYDRRSLAAMMIDPRADLMEEYRDFLLDHGLKPMLVVDTRTHWDHLSASHLFARSYGVPIGMGARTESRRVTRRLTHREMIQVGAWQVQVLETPGSARDAICLYGAGLLFSGDTLGISRAARVDLPGGSPEELWHSLREVIAPLPAETIVLPGQDREDVIFSTLQVEKIKGSDWRSVTRDEFLRAKADEKPPRGDAESRARLQWNSDPSPGESAESHFGGGQAAAAGESPRVAAISCDKFAQKMRDRAEGTCFVDVREPEEYRAGHISGTINIPLSELSLHLGELSTHKRIYLSCRSGRRSHFATRTLDYVGLPDVVNVLGGIQAWEAAGLPIEE